MADKMVDDSNVEKISYTEVLPTSKTRSLHTIQKGSDKYGNSFAQNMSIHTSKAALGGPANRDLIGEEAFSFEKSKLQQLRIEGTPAIDINDESVTKLKKEIFQRFNSILVSFEKISTVSRILAVVLLFVDILEMIGMFFMLLYMSLRMVPSEHILLWVGSALLLGLIQMFLLIKAISAAQSKELKIHKQYMVLAVVFFILALTFTILCMSSVIFGCEILTNGLKQEAVDTLRLVEKVLLILTAVKVGFQLLFFGMEGIQCHNLNMMAVDSAPATVPHSQKPIFAHEAGDITPNQH